MPGKEIGIEGGKALAAAFAKASEQATNAAEQALVRGALLVERDAKELTPVDTGRLRASITHRLTGAGSNEPVAEVGSNVFYAPYIEFGTGVYAIEGNGRKTPWVYRDDSGQLHRTIGAAAQPFLFPAFNQNKEKIRQMIAAAVKKDLGL